MADTEFSSPFSLENRTILITGASSGIGRSAAVQVSRMGGRVIALGQSIDKLNETLSLLNGEGHSYYSLDLTDIDNIEAKLTEISKEMGPLHGMVHSAGVSETILLRDMNLQYLEKMLRLNWLAFFALSKFACRRGRYAEGMSVVALASTAALYGSAGLSFYGGTKGAIISSVQALATEYAPRGIRFNAISPTMVNTPIMQQMLEDLGPEWYERIKKEAKLGILEPEDVVDTIIFLLSKASKKITGINIPITSGGR